MRIEFSDDGFLEINILSTGTAGIHYDCQISAQLKSEMSSGVKSVYIDGYELEGFIEELASLKDTLKGHAILTSESPEEFKLEIQPVDHVGHYALVIEIGERFHIGSNLFAAKVSNAFPIAAQEMTNICEKLITYFKSELSA